MIDSIGSIRSVAMLVLIGLVGCSGDSDGGSSTLRLQVEAGTYTVTNLRVVPSALPAEGNSSFRVVPGCTANSEVEQCPVQHFGLAKVRCQIYTNGGVQGLSARSKVDSPTSVTGSYDGCVDRVICGVMRVQPDGSYASVDLDNSGSAVMVEGLEEGCGIWEISIVLLKEVDAQKTDSTAPMGCTVFDPKRLFCASVAWGYLL